MSLVYNFLVAADNPAKHEFGIWHFSEGFLFPGATVMAVFLLGTPLYETVPLLLLGSWVGAAGADFMRRNSNETFPANEREFLSGFGAAVAIGLAVYGTEKPLAFIPALVIGAGAAYLAWRATRQK